MQKNIYGVIPNLADEIEIKNASDIISAIDNLDFDALRKNENFNGLVESIINLCKNDNLSISREEAENFIVKLLKTPKKISITEEEKDDIFKFMEEANKIVKAYIKKRW